MSNNISWSPFGFMGFGVLGIVLLAVVAILVLALKGYALWTAAKRDEKGWFIAILVINTFGILELVYLYFVVKKWRKPHHAPHAHHETHHHEHKS